MERNQHALRLRRIRRHRTLALAAAFTLGHALGTDPAPPPPAAPISQPRAASKPCGHYPKVALPRDCNRPERRRYLKTHRHPKLRCIRHHESRSRYQAISPRGTYRGAYQFSRSTWASVGPNRFDKLDPAQAPRWLQDQRARRLLKLRGTQPWPTPHKKGC